MAAAIKMDELLVSWLGSDNVYEHVLKAIETQKRNYSSKQDEEKTSSSSSSSSHPLKKNSSSNATTSQTPPGSPSRVTKKGEEKKEKEEDSKSGTASSSSGSAGAGEGGEEDASSNASPRCVIPPFYRPHGGALSSSSSVSSVESGSSSLAGVDITPPPPPPMRRRCASFSEDQTWDGIYTPAKPSSEEGGEEEGGGGGGSSQTGSTTSNDKTSTKPENKKKLDRSSSSSSVANNSKAENETTTNETDDANNKGPKVCIREQVKAIYNELGKDDPSSEEEEEEEESLFKEDGMNKNRYLTVENFVRITKDVCNFPTFFNGPLYKRILLLWTVHRTSSGEEEEEEKVEKEEEDDVVMSEVVTFEMMKWYWKNEMEVYDMSERFFRLLKQPEAEFVGRDDFLPYIKELLNDHPGLEFLSNHAEFQEKYAVTVITRIFYSVNRCHSGRITSRQIRRSDLLSAFQQVDEEEDINKVTRYFSYEHFYVLYCRFWELDHDRDYRITREDLLKYGDHSLSHMIVDRIFDAAPRPFEGTSHIDGMNGEDGDNNGEGGDNNGQNSSPTQRQQGQQQQNGAVNRDYLSYEDFIFFMLSEEDKANEISVRYWFTCIDVDGDGKLNNMEMRSFYAVQLHRMQCMGHEIVPFEDMLCQMIDMIKPANNDFLVVEDFLQTECAQVSGALFDALFNLNKYLQFEQRDPFMERQKREDEFETDWDRFACIDYNRLAMEEEAREEEAMEIDWVTVDDEDDDGDDFNSLGLGGASEAPF